MDMIRAFKSMDRTLREGVKRKMVLSNMEKSADRIITSRMATLREENRENDLKSILKILKCKEFKESGFEFEDYNTTNNGTYTFLIKDLRTNTTKWMLYADIKKAVYDRGYEDMRKSFFY